MGELWSKREWIPVTEALPEKHQMVLMYYNGTKVGDMRVGCVVDTYFGQKVWTVKDVGAIVPRCVCAPDFWMPLPEPPGGGWNNGRPHKISDHLHG